MNTKLAFAALPALTFLIACAVEMTPEQLYDAGQPFETPFYRSGATLPELENDKLDCEVSAAQRVPQNIQVNTTPTYTTPAYTTCNNIGYSTVCNTTGGQTYGGNAYSFDANSDLRLRAYSQCMAQKGWHFASIPPCPEGVTPAQLTFNGNGLPALNGSTCYIAREGVQVIGNLSAP